MKYFKFLILTIIFIFYSGNAHPVTGDEAFEKLKERLANITTLKGKITISYQSGEIYTGDFQYMPPGKIYIKFTDPPGKVIASNGRKLWAFDSTTEVCGVQELYMEDKEKDEELSEEEKAKKEQKIKGGLANLFYYFKPTLTYEGPIGYLIDLKQERRQYPEVSLSLDKTFMIVEAYFKNKNDNNFSVRFSNFKFGEKIFPDLFNFNVPSNAQVVKNPLDIR